MKQFRYPYITLEFSKSNNAEMIAIDSEIRECEAIRNQLVAELAEIDSSIQKYKETLYKASEDSFHVSGKALNNISERHVKSGKLNSWDKTNLLVGVASAGVGTVTGMVGFVSGLVKEHAARKEFNKKMDDLLEKKMTIAEERLPYIAEIYDKMTSGPLARMEKLYSSLFESSVSGEYDLICKQVEMFKSALGMALKARTLDDSFIYIISEMQAWLNGSHDTDYKKSRTIELFYDELDTWPAKFGFSSWLDMSRAAYESEESSIRLPMAFAFTDPVMLSQFVRIGLPYESSLLCDKYYFDDDEKKYKYSSAQETDFMLQGTVTEKIDKENHFHDVGTISLKDTVAGSLIARNEYYKSCNEIAENDYVFPKEPDGFGGWDLVVIVLEVAVIIGYVCLIRHIFGGWFFRMLFIWVPAIFLLFHIRDFLSFCRNLLPYKIREDDYLSSRRNSKKSIIIKKRKLFDKPTIKL